MTFANNIESDLRSLNAYREFRIGSRTSNFDHFLEVFNPPIDIGIAESELGHYINDMIVKVVAGVTSLDAPKSLKIQFNGHKALAELSQYDPENLIVGILGGAAGTTRDTFELVHQAEQASARVALFGRKINLAESPIDLVRLMHETIEQKITPEAAVSEYHKILADKGLTPQRKLTDDMAISDPVLMDSRAGWFNRVLVGTELHRYHHSADMAEAGNYASFFSVIDRSFGTYCLLGTSPAKLGITDREKYPSNSEWFKFR